MNIKEIRKRIVHIRCIAKDHEVAHAAEDALYVDVLRTIAAGTQKAKELAAEALKSQDIRFSRWCA